MNTGQLGGAGFSGLGPRVADPRAAGWRTELRRRQGRSRVACSPRPRSLCGEREVGADLGLRPEQRTAGRGARPPTLPSRGSEAGLKAPADRRRASAHFLAHVGVLPPCPHVEEGRGAPRGLFYKDARPIHTSRPPHPHMASASPQGLNPPKVRTRVTGSGPECLTWQVEGGIWESGNFKMLPGDAHRTGPGNPLFCRRESASIRGPRLPVASVPGCPSSSLQRRSGASLALAHTGMLQKSTACVIGPDEALGQTPDGADSTDTQFILQQSSRTSLLRLKDIFSSRSR